MNLKTLAADHPYYASETNFYSLEASGRYVTVTDFLNEMEEYDIDMNLVYRWDVREKRDEDDDEPLDIYYAEVFMIHQRKGVYHPIMIDSISEHEVDRFVAYLHRHLEVQNKMWEPLT